MNLLILGKSSLVQRRAMPALAGLKYIGQIDVASIRNPNATGFPETWRGKIFDNYAEALEKSAADTVYVSLVNNDHEYWVEAALNAGKHVVVDKPAFMSISAATRLLALAESNNLALAEAVVFFDHPRIAWIQDFLAQGEEITRVEATFCIPPLPPENYRYQKDLGGGSLFDQGPYAAATSRLFFNAEIKTLACQINTVMADYGVDISFSVLATYENGKSMVGHFGFDTEYQNRITAFGPNGAYVFDRVFTPPEEEITVRVRKSNQNSIETFPPSNCFGTFFERLNTAIDSNDWSDFTHALKHDAVFVDKLISAAREVT